MFLPPITARAIKISVLLNPTEILALRVPFDQQRVTLRVKVEGRELHADVAAKSVRKAIATIRELGSDGCVVMIVGKLDADDAVLECGLSAQAKAPKPAPAPVPADKSPARLTTENP